MIMTIPFIKSHHLLKEYQSISEKIILNILSDLEERTKSFIKLVQSLNNSIDQLQALQNVTRAAYVKKAYKKNSLLLNDLKQLSAILYKYYRFNELLNSLKNTLNDKSLIDAITILSSRLESEYQAVESGTDFDLIFNEYRNGFIKYKEAVKDVKPDAKNFSIFKKELRRIYDSGRNYHSVCRLDPIEKNLFEFSKSVKDFHFIISTLTPIWEILFDVYSNEIKSLSDSLIKINVLYELLHYIQSLIDNPYDFSDILTLIDSQLTVEIEKSINQGELIYSIPPDVFAIHLKSFYSTFKNYSAK